MWSSQRPVSALGLYFDYVMLPLWIGITAVWLVTCVRGGNFAPRLTSWLAVSVIAGVVSRPLWAHLTETFTNQVGGSYLTMNLQPLLGVPPLRGSTFPWLLAGFGVLALAGALCLGRLLARDRGGATTISLLVLAFILVTGAAPVPRFYTVKKLAVTGWPFVVLVVAWLIGRAGRWRRLLAGTALVVSMTASGGPASVAQGFQPCQARAGQT